MCSALLMDGEAFETIRELTQKLGFAPPSDGEPYTGEETYCLCGVDFPKLSELIGRRIELDSWGIDYVVAPSHKGEAS